MGAILRRALLALGAALLAAGWGVLRYAEAQQRAVADGKSESLSLWVGERTKVSAWVEGNRYVAGKTLATGGIISMGIGAALVALTLAGNGNRFNAGP